MYIDPFGCVNLYQPSSGKGQVFFHLLSLTFTRITNPESHQSFFSPSPVISALLNKLLFFIFVVGEISGLKRVSVSFHFFLFHRLLLVLHTRIHSSLCFHYTRGHEYSLLSSLFLLDGGCLRRSQIDQTEFNYNRG